MISECKQGESLFGITDGKNLSPLNLEQFQIVEKITQQETLDDFIACQNKAEREIFKELCMRLEKGNYLRWLKKDRMHSI